MRDTPDDKIIRCLRRYAKLCIAKLHLVYSQKIYTNRLTFDIHAGISYGGLGLFAKYSPLPKFNKEISNGIEVECGPQFQTWTVGLILGLGM